MIVFDIETGPLDEETVLSRVKGFQPPECPGEFDPSLVKTGNLKDPEKIKTKIADAQTKHERSIINFEQDVDELRLQWRDQSMSRASLDALTGQVLAVGYQSESGVAVQTVDSFTEKELIQQFWDRYQSCRNNGRKMPGHNIFGFDLPFIIRRSWLLELDVPETAFDVRFWDSRVFVDTMKKWTLGAFNEYVSLDCIGKAFGSDGKPDGISGGDFANLFFGSEEEKEMAIDYLRCDLQITFDVAMRMGVS